MPAEVLTRLFAAIDLRIHAPEPSWNVAPSQSVTAAVWDPRRERRVLLPLSWGLLAPWEKHWESARVRPINARAETVATSKMFAPAFRKQRALIAVDAWYEWAKEGGRKIPHALARADGGPTVLGGIWECWRGSATERMLTLAIVTTPATPELAGIHDRMPLVLEEADWSAWLSQEDGDAAALLRPAVPGRIASWRVGGAVGNPRNNGAEILAAA